ncbi:MAG: hypothetical protein ABEK59_11590 [Halobacteria archaeon]
MKEYKRRSYIDAPLEEVWSFYSRLSGLFEVTPDRLGIDVSRIKRPDEDWTDKFDTDEILEEGTRMEMYLSPCGLLPVLRWRSEITVRERNDNDAFFVDRALDGPFEGQYHIHGFVRYDGGTVMQDTFVYPTVENLPSFLEKPQEFIVDRGFRYRHRRSREVLE